MRCAICVSFEALAAIFTRNPTNVQISNMLGNAAAYVNRLAEDGYVRIMWKFWFLTLTAVNRFIVNNVCINFLYLIFINFVCDMFKTDEGKLH